MAEGFQEDNVSGFGGFVGPGEGPSSAGLIGGSGYQQMDEGAEDSPTAPDTTGMPDDPTFSGSNAVIDVDTFEDIQKAQSRRQQGGEFSVSANPAISLDLQVEDFSNIRSAFARTMGNVETGSVNLAPIGINVGYQSNIGKIDSFDQLDASTKAAVKAAGIQSQSEDETENAIAQIFGAFQSILNKASKNTTNRQMGGSGSMGPDQ